MAAFTVEDPTDRDAFMAHWFRLLNDETIIIRTIVAGGQVAGHVLSYERCGEREVSYWIEKSLWGQSIATAALAAYLELVTMRPLYARAAKDNVASIRVLEKCGFRSYGTDTGFANARGAEITEILLKLE